ncbi:hypothetical protein DFJ74DRAFT_698881 [Hyaloraphidium curvatum]|nr:hypothetical protein DFJ74DRAFT_698881 [Hyaloraphidium curvatum]
MIRCGDASVRRLPAHPATSPHPAPKHARDFALADYFTLGNGICGIASYLSSAAFLVSRDPRDLWWAIWLQPLSFLCDTLDGRVARWMGNGQGSLFGQELDSLADLVSFSVAPSMLAFAVGMRTAADCAVLVFFVACGISRLARFNATINVIKDEKGQIKYFEGTPVPTTLALTVTVGYFLRRGMIEDALPFGVRHLWPGGPLFHPYILLWFASGCAQISKSLRIPKP